MNLFGHLVGLFGGGPPRRKASTYIGQHDIEKSGHTSMIRTPNPSVRALDGTAIGIGNYFKFQS